MCEKVTFCNLVAETRAERGATGIVKEMQTVFTAGHILTYSNKVRSAKPLSTPIFYCSLYCASEFPTQIGFP